MARDNIPSNFTDKEMTLFFAVEAFFDSGTVRLWTGFGKIEFGGNTYTGAGNLLGLSEIHEGSDIQARGMKISLSGIPSELLGIALNEPYQNRELRIYVGTLDNGTQAHLLSRGRIDTMRLQDSGDTAAIEVAVENRLIDLERNRIRRYTAEDQKALFPGDTGLDYVAGIQGKPLTWGRPS
jgi:hypothetical protein